MAYCKECTKKQRAEHGALNRDRLSKISRERYANLTPEEKEAHHAKDRAWRVAHKDQLHEASVKNKDIKSEYWKQYYSSHAEEIKATHREATRMFPEKRALARKLRRGKDREIEKNRMAEDPVYRLTKHLRSSVRAYLKGKIKAGHSLELVGIPAIEWMKHIESTFWPGMSEAGQGKNGWHVDHIAPLSSFDLTNPEEQKRAFHWSNTQALWGDDNYKKNNRLDWSPLESRFKLPERLSRLEKSYWSIVLQ